jgi:hypothetical protein
MRARMARASVEMIVGIDGIKFPYVYVARKMKGRVRVVPAWFLKDRR